MFALIHGPELANKGAKLDRSPVAVVVAGSNRDLGLSWIALGQANVLAWPLDPIVAGDAGDGSLDNGEQAVAVAVAAAAAAAAAAARGNWARSADTDHAIVVDKEEDGILWVGCEVLNTAGEVDEVPCVHARSEHPLAAPGEEAGEVQVAQSLLSSHPSTAVSDSLEPIHNDGDGATWLLCFKILPNQV